MAAANSAFNAIQKDEEQVEKKVTKPGRPRSSASRKAILGATRRLLAVSPLSELSIEAIAKKVGPDKPAVKAVLEATGISK